eukprot:TRINITY_DN7648_c0_g1_i1.p1 TRINITY_DN7648_c0_g1~~TRINITY_DN7648_c0_g1_i1.p1  ORF type:complete len:181 (-),score=43.70 TRINITY_DN7648_c0_g1_i1:173-715(-)
MNAKEIISNIAYLVLYLGLGWGAGSVGSFANSLTALAISYSGLGEYIGVGKIEVTSDWWYDRVFWGALYGFMFAIPIPTIIPFYIRGPLLSLVVSFMNFLVFLPMHDKGFFGVENSDWFWVNVILNNLAWGIAGVCVWEFEARFVLADLPGSLYQKRFGPREEMMSVNNVFDEMPAGKRY